MRKQYLICILVVGLSLPVIAEINTKSDSVKQKKQKIVKKKSSKENSEEMVLEEIQIKGRVDKPGVIIVPKRVEPEMSKIELDRNFNKEIKEGVGEIPKPDKELRSLDRVKSIKKTLNRKRK